MTVCWKHTIYHKSYSQQSSSFCKEVVHENHLIRIIQVNKWTFIWLPGNRITLSWIIFALCCCVDADLLSFREETLFMHLYLLFMFVYLRNWFIAMKLKWKWFLSQFSSSYFHLFLFCAPSSIINADNGEVMLDLWKLTKMS